MLHGVAADRIALVPNGPDRIGGVLESIATGPIVVFPPFERSGIERPLDLMEIERDDRFRVAPSIVERLSVGATAVVMTPNDPTGTGLEVSTATRLGSRAGFLVIDDRSPEIRGRSFVPAIEEFESILLVRSFEEWAGLEHAPAYVIGSRRLAKALDRSEEVAPRDLALGLAAVRDASRLDAIAHRVRIERNRLYRMLRKSNALEPSPSSAGYVLARVARGDRDTIHAALRARGVTAYASQHPRLRETLRFSALSPVATQRLQRELIDICRTVLDVDDGPFEGRPLQAG